MRLHKKLEGFFRLKGISQPSAAAGDTLDRAAVKICAGAPVPDVERYCAGIARNVFLEWLRREQRERSVFTRFVEGLKDNSDEEVERIERVLRPCFEQLDDEERELLFNYCRVMRGRERAESRRRLAEAMKTTVLALRMRVTRLRGVLAECVRRRSREGLATI